MWNVVLLLIHLSLSTVVSLKFVAAVIFIFGHWDRHIRPLLTNDAAIFVANSIVSSRLDYCNSLLCNASEHSLNKLQCIPYRILWHVLPVNLLVHPVLLTSGSRYIGYHSDNMLFTQPLWLHIKLWKQDSRFFYVTCFIITNQLVLWDPPVNYYSISRRQGSTFNPRHSVSLHQPSGTLCLHLWKVLLLSLPSWHIWNLNCLQLRTTHSNISSTAGASNPNSWHTAPPINVFDIWHLEECGNSEESGGKQTESVMSQTLIHWFTESQWRCWRMADEWVPWVMYVIVVIAVVER